MVIVLGFIVFGLLLGLVEVSLVRPQSFPLSPRPGITLSAVSVGGIAMLVFVTVLVILVTMRIYSYPWSTSGELAPFDLLERGLIVCVLGVGAYRIRKAYSGPIQHSEIPPAGALLIPRVAGVLFGVLVLSTGFGVLKRDLGPPSVYATARVHHTISEAVQHGPGVIVLIDALLTLGPFYQIGRRILTLEVNPIRLRVRAFHPFRGMQVLTYAFIGVVLVTTLSSLPLEFWYETDEAMGWADALDAMRDIVWLFAGGLLIPLYLKEATLIVNHRSLTLTTSPPPEAEPSGLV